MIFAAASYLLLVLAVAALALEVWALVEACRFHAASYVAAGKQTKPLWVTVLGFATAIGAYYALVRNPLGFLSLAAVAASAVFLAGVRPALRSVQGHGRSGGGGSGPYGGW